MTNLPRCIPHFALLSLALACTLASANAQSTSNSIASNTSVDGATAAVPAVPPLVRFSGVAKEADGAALSGTIGVTFSIYKDQQGGAPLWIETQNVEPDSAGQYSVMLGATKPDGLPTYLFASGDARWLAVQISGQAEQPRVLLVSVPYAMKAADADTVGGLPASAFLLAAPQNAATAEATTTAQPQAAVTGVTADATPTGSGTLGYLPLWTTPSNLGNSGIFQSSSGLIGINTSTPAVTLDVAGNMYIRGGFTMPPEGTATASTGFTSHSYYFSASAYNSTSAAAEDQTFAWEAVPLGNDTATPSATLKLRFAEGTGSSVATGFQIASNGILSFATGQTFPATAQLNATNTFVGNQTVTGTVTANATTNGVSGATSGTFPFNSGVAGTASSNSGSANGVYGTSAAPQGAGVAGFSNTNVGVFGDTSGSSSTSYGVEGYVTALTGSAVGVYGNSGFGTGFGVEGVSLNVGVLGSATGASSYGVEGSSPNVGLFGVGGYGVDAHGSIAGVKGLATASGGYSGLFAGGPLLVGGNANNAILGDPGCGSGYAGLAFATSGTFSTCTNYAVLGGSAGGTYINSSGTASIHFRSNNNELATIDNSGNVNIIGQNGGGNLSVSGKETSGNLFAQVSAANSTGSQVSPGACTQGTLTTSDANCLVPDMSLTATTANPTALIMVNIGGVTTDPCATANFYLLVDGKIEALSTISLNSNNSAFGYEIGSVNITKLQNLAPGSHTFEVQSTTDLAGASCSTFTVESGVSQGDGGMGSFRSLVVREF
jgi:trimeric autotransporter adhesin